MNSIPARICFWCVIGAVLGLSGVRSSSAQYGPDVPSVVRAETRTNLFAILDLSSATEGIRVDLPRNWTLEKVTVLRYGSQEIPVRVRTEGTETWIVSNRPLRGPHEVILNVETGRGQGSKSWSLVPARRRGATWQVNEAQRFSRRITLEASPRLDATNRALAFAENSQPIQVEAEALPEMDRSTSFTVEAWMRTTGLDEIVLSTWSGDEHDAYPLEIVVDPSGRLRSYCGRPGRHQALVSQAHVADGRWHHAAVVYAAERQSLRLFLDGVPVDSLTDVTLPVPSRRAPPLAIGGRPASSEGVRFSGAVDEVRLWSTARSARDIREAMRRPSVAGAHLQVHLGFDDEASTVSQDVARWSNGVERRPSTLALRTSLQNLKATADGSTVHLRWSADATDVQSFVVERSADGATFSTVATLDPTAVAQPKEGGRTRTFAYADEGVSGQVVFYRIRQVYTDGVVRTSGILKMGLGLTSTADSTVKLLGNFPNPFTETTTIAYEVNERVSIMLSVWNLTGNRVARLVDEVQAPGRYEHPFDASDLPSGTYFIRLQTSEGVQSHRMVVLK